jgi:hypothetical protein
MLAHLTAASHRVQTDRAMRQPRQFVMLALANGRVHFRSEVLWRTNGKFRLVYNSG